MKTIIISASWRGQRCLASLIFFAYVVPFFAWAGTLYKSDYHYDHRGMVTNIVEQYGEQAGELRDLEYDSLGRLVREEFGAFAVAYQYDRLGNRILQTNPSEQQVYQYNTRNELLRQDWPGRTRYLSYDLNGSLTQKVDAAVSTSYDWDSRGRLERVTSNSVEIFRAVYAGGLNRLRKTEGGDSKVYRHDGSTAIQEIDEAGSVKELVRGDRGASTVGGVLYSADEEGTNTYTYNGVGSTVVLSENDRSARHVKYESFGNVLEIDEGVDLERLANTKELDQSTGLYYHGARYYDPELGRYISMDPIRDGANYYVYARNAPLSYVDPTGLSVEKLKPSGWQLIGEGLKWVWNSALNMGINAGLDPIPCGAGGAPGICPGPAGPISYDMNWVQWGRLVRSDAGGRAPNDSVFMPEEVGQSISSTPLILNNTEDFVAHAPLIAKMLKHLDPKHAVEAKALIDSSLKQQEFLILVMGKFPMIYEPAPDGKKGARPVAYDTKITSWQPHGVVIVTPGNIHRIAGAAKYGIPDELTGTVFNIDLFSTVTTLTRRGVQANDRVVPMYDTVSHMLIGLERSVANLGERTWKKGGGMGQRLRFPRGTSLLVFPHDQDIPIPAHYRVGNALAIFQPRLIFESLIVKPSPAPPGADNKYLGYTFKGFSLDVQSLMKLK